MKLDEITISRKLRRGIEATHSREDIDPSLREQLKKSGWHFIDSGLFSQVYVKEGNPYVLKINTVPDNAFDKFVRYTHRVKSPYLPKIYDRKYFTKKGRTYYIYLIEKLEKCPVELSAAIYDATTSLKYHDEAGSVIQQYPGLEEIIVKLINDASILVPDGIVDIGRGNVMLRPSDNMPVIIDPWAVLKDRYKH